jgi:hypothetical protein
MIGGIGSAIRGIEFFAALIALNIHLSHEGPNVFLATLCFWSPNQRSRDYVF